MKTIFFYENVFENIEIMNIIHEKRIIGVNNVFGKYEFNKKIDII